MSQKEKLDSLQREYKRRPEQYHGLSKAIENRRKLATTLTKMEKLSRRILFSSLTDTRRRRPLNENVLQTI